MFIENPNKKESYSFRVKPELLKKIKQYAKATDQTVPEILNNMIEDKVDGLHLTNDYLENKLAFNGVIGLPSLTDIYNNGDYKEFKLFGETSNRVLYEIQQVPNNLDIWTDKDGFKSDKRGIDHEGLSFILAPELITKPEYLETPDLLLCCLIPVYFAVSIKQIRKSTVQVQNISFDNALEKINQAPNIELLDDFTSFTNNVKEVISSYHNMLNNARENPDGTYYARGITYNGKRTMLIDLHSKLITELKEYSINVNTNFLNHYDGAIERQTKKLENNTLLADNTYVLLDEIDKLQNENENLENRVKELETGLSSILEILKYSDSD